MLLDNLRNEAEKLDRLINEMKYNLYQELDIEKEKWIDELSNYTRWDPNSNNLSASTKLMQDWSKWINAQSTIPSSLKSTQTAMANKNYVDGQLESNGDKMFEDSTFQEHINNGEFDKSIEYAKNKYDNNEVDLKSFIKTQAILHKLFKCYVDIDYFKLCFDYLYYNILYNINNKIVKEDLEFYYYIDKQHYDHYTNEAFLGYKFKIDDPGIFTIYNICQTPGSYHMMYNIKESTTDWDEFVNYICDLFTFINRDDLKFMRLK